MTIILNRDNATKSTLNRLAEKGHQEGIKIYPVAALEGVYTATSSQRDKNYLVVVRQATAGITTVCSCEAGSPSTLSREPSLCKHVSLVVEALKATVLARPAYCNFVSAGVVTFEGVEIALDCITDLGSLYLAVTRLEAIVTRCYTSGNSTISAPDYAGAAARFKAVLAEIKANAEVIAHIEGTGAAA